MASLNSAAIPDVPALTDVSAKIQSLAQEIMMVTYQRPEGSMLVEISGLLMAAGTTSPCGSHLSQAIRRSSRTEISANPRVVLSAARPDRRGVPISER
jgi:hypothetical protein